MKIGRITISDRASAGIYEDRSGPEIENVLREFFFGANFESKIVPDEVDLIASALKNFADELKCDLVVTTGGTGISARDVTPEATRSVLEREVPGIAEHIRTRGMEQTKLAVLSRGLAGQRKRSLIVNLPGSPRGALFSLQVIEHLVPHVVDLLQGRTEHA